MLLWAKMSKLGLYLVKNVSEWYVFCATEYLSVAV